MIPPKNLRAPLNQTELMRPKNGEDGEKMGHREDPRITSYLKTNLQSHPGSFSKLCFSNLKLLNRPNNSQTTESLKSSRASLKPTEKCKSLLIFHSFSPSRCGYYNKTHFTNV